MSKGKKGFGGMPGRGMGMPGGMGGLMSQVQKLQEEMAKTQEALANEELTVTAGGGAVSVVITGSGEIRGLTIKPEVVDPDDVEMLQDLILAALMDAQKQAKELEEQRMGGLTGGLGLPPGLF